MAKSRKLPMVKRGTQKERSVSFTKRRQGLFNKAAELFMLCDVQIAVLVASPSEKKPKSKMYSFGQPSVSSVLDAYVQKRAPLPLDDQAKQKSVALWKEIDCLESQPEEGLDDFQGSESVGDLQKLVGALEKMIAQAKGRLEFEHHDQYKYSFGANMMVESASSHELKKDSEMIKRIDHELNNENSCWNYEGEGNNDLIYGNEYPLPQDYCWSTPLLI